MTKREISSIPSLEESYTRGLIFDPLGYISKLKVLDSHVGEQLTSLLRDSMSSFTKVVLLTENLQDLAISMIPILTCLS